MFGVARRGPVSFGVGSHFQPRWGCDITRADEDFLPSPFGRPEPAMWPALFMSQTQSTLRLKQTLKHVILLCRGPFGPFQLGDRVDDTIDRNVRGGGNNSRSRRAQCPW